MYHYFVWMMLASNEHTMPHKRLNEGRRLNGSFLYFVWLFFVLILCIFIGKHSLLPSTSTEVLFASAQTTFLLITINTRRLLLIFRCTFFQSIRNFFCLLKLKFISLIYLYRRIYCMYVMCIKRKYKGSNQHLIRTLCTARFSRQNMVWMLDQKKKQKTL